jgi:hypothetical protein
LSATPHEGSLKKDINVPRRSEEGPMSKRLWILIAACALAFGGLAFSSAASGGDAAKTKTKTRNIYLSAVEWKGSANISKEAYPTKPLPEGGGYERFAPDAKGDWSIETYRFDSAMVPACKGERVVLNLFGVNAKEHHLVIPAFNRNFTVYRGQLATTSFMAKKVGIFPIICITHQPSHRADIVVLPC